MHTLKLNIQDGAFDKIIYLLNNLPKNDVEIIEEKSTQENWSFLESEIDIGINSGINQTSHEEIVNNIKRKYA